MFMSNSLPLSRRDVIKPRLAEGRQIVAALLATDTHDERIGWDHIAISLGDRAAVDALAARCKADGGLKSAPGNGFYETVLPCRTKPRLRSPHRKPSRPYDIRHPNLFNFAALGNVAISQAAKAGGGPSRRQHIPPIKTA